MKLCIRLLCGKERNNWINPDLFITLTNFMHKGYGRFEMDFGLMTDSSPVEYARNCAAHDSLRSHADWLLMIDNDQSLPANLVQLVEEAHADSDINIVSLPTYMLRGGVKNPKPTVNSWVERDRSWQWMHRPSLPVASGFQEVGDAGAGVFLIRTRVFETLQEPWFKVRYDEQTCAPLCGEDDFFNEEAQRAGFKVHTHSGYECSHFKTVDLAAYSSHLKGGN
jgi:hypothetical protein